MVRRNLTTVNDDRLRLGTGHPSEHWFGLLDAAGAVTWRHSKIAAFLEDHRVRAWWAEVIATAYERARGLCSDDSMWTATATRIINTSLTDAWHFIEDASERYAWIGEDWPEIAVREGRFVRLDCHDGTDVTLRLSEVDDNVRISVQHAKLASEDQSDSTEKLWDAALKRLADVID